MAKRTKAAAKSEPSIDAPAPEPIANQNTTDIEAVGNDGHIEETHTKHEVDENGEPRNNPREEIMRDIHAKRAKQLQNELDTGAAMTPMAQPIDETPEPAAPSVAAPTNDAAGSSPPAPQGEEADLKAASSTEAAQAPTDDDSVKYKIKVNGREMDVSLEEMKSLAQKSAAAQEAWQQANQMRQQAQQMMFQQPPQQNYTQQPSAQGVQPSIPQQNKSNVSDEMADKFARDMNYGSAEEQRKAIRELVDNVVASTGRSQPTPNELVQGAAQQALAAVRHEQAVSMVGKEYEDVFKDADFTQLAMTQLQRIVQDQQARYQAGLPVQPRSGYEVMREACQYVRDKFVKPLAPPQQDTAPQTTVQAAVVAPMQERLERKRAAPQQPQAANKVATEAPRKQKWEKSPKEIFAEIQKARHQAAYQ